MALKNLRISQATPLTKAEISSGLSPLIPAFDGTANPRNISFGLMKEIIHDSVEVEFVKKDYLEANYYTKEEVEARTIDPEVVDKVDSIVDTVERLDGDADTVGSVVYQINEAKRDLIGTINDSTSQDTIHAAKKLVAESLQFTNYYY